MSRCYCQTCLRPMRGCLCSLIRRQTPPFEIGILQHPSEVKQAKGTAHLLHLCLPNSRLWVGEQIEDLPELQAWLSAKPTYLLYPDASPGLVTKPAQSLQDIQVLLLDGTWRKTYKILQLNPQLQALPRIGLQHLPTSRYSIRKAQRDDSLSTFEAGLALIKQLDAMQDYTELDKVFAEFIQQQQAFLPKI